MIKRIKNIIRREKIKYPDGNGLTLLLKRIIKVLRNKINIGIRKDSTFNTEEEMLLCSLLPKKVLDLIILCLKPQSILDVGCGTGRSLGYFIENGIDAWGIENSRLAKKKAKYASRIIKHNLNRPLNMGKKFDLAWCFEVIEHIHPKYEKSILKTLTNHSSLIILSAAVPGQGGVGHFNEQPQEYWIKKFENLAYKYDEEFSTQLKKTKDHFSENIMVFKEL